MTVGLPYALEVNGKEYSIRWDCWSVLDVFEAMNDPELDDRDRAIAVLVILYRDYEAIPPAAYKEAVDKALWFINGGQTEERAPRRSPKLVDWEQDLPYIVAPINRIIGHEIRDDRALHWWTFLSAYYEIGDCLFAQIVRIRNKQARGKKLDKAEREWYRDNRRLVDIKTRYTDKDNEILAAWGIK